VSSAERRRERREQRGGNKNCGESLVDMARSLQTGVTVEDQFTELIQQAVSCFGRLDCPREQPRVGRILTACRAKPSFLMVCNGRCMRGRLVGMKNAVPDHGAAEKREHSSQCVEHQRITVPGIGGFNIQWRKPPRSMHPHGCMEMGEIGYRVNGHLPGPP